MLMGLGIALSSFVLQNPVLQNRQDLFFRTDRYSLYLSRAVMKS
jgi:hypothetical protein